MLLRACCWLSVFVCLLLVVDCCLLVVVCCVSRGVCFLSFVACCLLLVVRVVLELLLVVFACVVCWLFGVGWCAVFVAYFLWCVCKLVFLGIGVCDLVCLSSLCVVYCLLFVVCWLSFVVRCVLFVVCWIVIGRSLWVACCLL